MDRVLAKKGSEVIDYPVGINSETFKDDYPNVFSDFFRHITEADILFVFNKDKNGIEGYIGAETFAEIAFAVVQKRIQKQDIEILLLKKPSSQVQSFDEIKLWLEYGWIQILER